MADPVRGVADSETPVNPYSLLEAVNASSETAHRAWLIFLALMIYLMVAVAGVTHRDLLLETPVSLPILQVSIQLTQFFQFAPVVLVLLHMGVISQLVLLARKTLEFDHAIRLLELNDRRRHPLRLELHNFFFVQAIAGPERSSVMSGFLHAMSWLTLAVLPVVLILYIQVAFLPYHDIAITWTHRIALVIDIALLVLIGVFLMRAETSFWQAFWRTTLAHPISFGMTALVLTLIGMLSFFAATIPGEALDRISKSMLGVAEGTDASGNRRYAGGFNIPILPASADGRLFGIFTTNLVVTDSDLVADKDVTPGEPTLKLRGRDLTFAKLDRSDLHQADFTDADLSNASLVGTDLRGALMHCADLNELLLSNDRHRAHCASARHADFSGARLDGAQMTGIDLTEARLEEARLSDARLTFATLAGANLSSAVLAKADLTGGVQAQGANFLLAALQGADLTGAQLQYADFTSAGMQGVGLNYAALQSAVLRDADLEGADMQQTKLYGADMTGAKLQGVDMRYAAIWAANPPAPSALTLADLTNVQLAPPSDAERMAVQGLLDKMTSEKTRKLVAEALVPVLDQKTSKAWGAGGDVVKWRSMVSQSSNGAADATFAAQLTEFLAQSMCRPRWAKGSVATGIARRAQSELFRGDMRLIEQRLTSDSCPAGKAIPPRVMQDLTAAVDRNVEEATSGLPR